MGAKELFEKEVLGLPVWGWLLLGTIVFLAYSYKEKVFLFAGKAADKGADAAGKAADAAKTAASKAADAAKTAATMRAGCTPCMKMKADPNASMRAAFAEANAQAGLTGGDARRIAMMNGDDVFQTGMDTLTQERIECATEGMATFGADDASGFSSNFGTTERRAGMTPSEYTHEHMHASLPATTATDHSRWTSSLVARAKGSDGDLEGVPSMYPDDRYLSRMSSAYGAEFEESPLVGKEGLWALLTARSSDAKQLSSHGYNRGQLEGGGREVGQRALATSRIANVQCADGCSDQ
jgi:hypothetical protein